MACEGILHNGPQVQILLLRHRIGRMKTLPVDSCSVQMLAPQPPASAHPASVLLGRPPCAGPPPPRCAKRAPPPRDEPEEILPRWVVFWWMLCVMKMEVYKEVAAAANWVISQLF